MTKFLIISLIVILNLYIIVNIAEVLFDFMDDRKVKFSDVIEIVIQTCFLFLLCYIYI